MTPPHPLRIRLLMRFLIVRLAIWQVLFRWVRLKMTQAEEDYNVTNERHPWL